MAQNDRKAFALWGILPMPSVPRREAIPMPSVPRGEVAETIFNPFHFSWDNRISMLFRYDLNSTRIVIQL